ncbi:MAG: hypothetical protein ABSB15_14565 [Bryobacteraceae bacterium]
MSRSSRRELLGFSCAGGLLTFSGSLAFGASDFWNRKQPSEWSVAEVEQLKIKSPWAKKVRGEMANSRAADGGRREGGGSRGGSGLDMSTGVGIGMGSGMGGGMGGAGNRGGMDSSPEPSRNAGVQGPEVLIRWENAQPLLDATKLTLPQALENHYAIGVTGVPPDMIAAFAQGHGGGADPAANQKAIIDRMRAGASLAVKGKDPVSSDHLMQTMDKQTMIFGFPKDALPLSAADKEVLFTLRLVAIFKAKFELREMMYGGQLAV